MITFEVWVKLDPNVRIVYKADWQRLPQSSAANLIVRSIFKDNYGNTWEASVSHVLNIGDIQNDSQESFARCMALYGIGRGLSDYLVQENKIQLSNKKLLDWECTVRKYIPTLEDIRACLASKFESAYVDTLMKQLGETKT